MGSDKVALTASDGGFTSAEFDPYYTWLGIAPEEQPPNHYRLLGIRLFEDNADVISNAADREMGHLFTFASEFSWPNCGDCPSQASMIRTTTVQDTVLCKAALREPSDWS